MTTDWATPSGVETGTGRARTPLGRGLNLAGVVVVSYWFVVNGTGHLSVLVFVVGGVALAAWVAREFLPTKRLRVVCSVLMVVLGALTTGATGALLIAPVIAGIVVLAADPDAAVWIGWAVAGGAAVVIAVDAVIDGAGPGYLLGALAGIALGVAIATSRRQMWNAARQRDEILARTVEAEREQQRAALLADRARAARDIHDVLAHSLGGLVVQLDAVEALLEAGRIDDATRRVGDARGLAADGLAEARRAVSALREPAPGIDHEPEPEPEHEPRREPLRELVRAHRAFGGEVEALGDLDLPLLDQRHRETVLAVAREAFSNARRHAPGALVTLSVAEPPSVAQPTPVAEPAPTVEVRIENPVASGTRPRADHDGHGLLGMRERFAELDDASTVSVVLEDAVFVVAMTVPIGSGDDQGSAR